jgi:hypothetical protein
MKKHKSDIDKIEEALTRCYRRPVEQPEVGQLWQKRVMATIMEESESRRIDPNAFSRYGNTVWRFAFVASLVALLLAAYVVDSGSDVPYQLTEMVLEDSSVFDLAFAFGAM